MAGARGLKGLAAGAATFGLYSVATGQTWAALVAGLCSLSTAIVALRAVDARSRPVSSDDSATVPVPDLAEGLIGENLTEGIADALVGPFGRSPELLDEENLASVLRGRVAVARRALRPLSVVHVMIWGASDGPLPAELVAAAAEATLRESDIVGRRADGVYVFVLEDTAEDGAVWTTERLRRHVAGTIGPRRFQAGVASYPNHGLDADSVDASAARALEAAKDWDRDRIEVATG